MANRRSNSANAFQTTLTQSVNSTDLTFTVAATTGAPSSPAYFVIDPDDDAKREIIYCDSTFDATHLRTSALGNRHLSGSAASSGLTHDSGAIVAFVWVSQFMQDLHDRVGQHTHGGGNDGANIPSTSVTGLSGGGGGGGGGTAGRVVGEIIMSGSTSVPAGWLKCHGQAVSRTTYSQLFAAVGTSFGAGNGSSTFNLPDFRNRSPYGTNNTSQFPGTTAGTTHITLTTDQLPAHTHSGTTHTHSMSDTTTTDSHSHSGSASSSSHSHSLTMEATTNPDHNHNTLGDDPAAGTSGTSDTDTGTTLSSSHSHTLSISTDSHSHTFTGTTGSAGGTSTGSTGGGALVDKWHPVLGVDFLIYHGVV